MNFDEDKKESQLLLMISEDQLKSIVEGSVRKIILELKENVPDVDQWLTSEQVCNLLHISKSTIINWRLNGNLRSHKIGNRILFNREEILQKIKELRPFRSVEESVH